MGASRCIYYGLHPTPAATKLVKSEILVLDMMMACSHIDSYVYISSANILFVEPAVKVFIVA